MKILDLGNAGSRIKVFLLWGIVLFTVQFLGNLLVTPNTTGGIIIITISLFLSGFAGYMTARALKNNTGDKRPSTIYGALPPVFATILGWIVGFLFNLPLNIQLPLLPMLAGLMGGYISQRRLL